MQCPICNHEAEPKDFHLRTMTTVNGKVVLTAYCPSCQSSFEVKS